MFLNYFEKVVTSRKKQIRVSVWGLLLNNEHNTEFQNTEFQKQVTKPLIKPILKPIITPLIKPVSLPQVYTHIYPY